MLRNKAPTIEIDAYVLEQYPSFTADINIDETDKNTKQEEVFDGLTDLLSPDNDTVYITHDKKNNKYRVRGETSDKDTTRKLLHPRNRLKRKAQGRVIDAIYCPRKRKSKKETEKPSKKSSRLKNRLHA